MNCFGHGGDAVLFELMLGMLTSGLVDENVAGPGRCLGLRAYRGPLGPVFLGIAK